MDILFEFLIKGFGWLLKIIWSLVETAVITRPWYWIGWCVLRILSFGYFPMRSINSEHSETEAVKYIVYSVGIMVPISLILVILARN
jgi:hypothetical protein